MNGQAVGGMNTCTKRLIVQKNHNASYMPLLVLMCFQYRKTHYINKIRLLFIAIINFIDKIKLGSEDLTSAKLIGEADLKGYSIGDAEVSIKHSGFIINKGNATAEDVLKLVEYIKEKVYEKFQKKIELEIEIVGK